MQKDLVEQNFQFLVEDVHVLPMVQLRRQYAFDIDGGHRRRALDGVVFYLQLHPAAEYQHAAQQYGNRDQSELSGKTDTLERLVGSGPHIDEARFATARY